MLSINYTVSNPNNEYLDLWINEVYIGFYEIDPTGSGTITIEQVIPNNNTIVEYVELCVNDHPDCCYAEEFILEECPGIQDPNQQPYQLFYDNSNSNITLAIQDGMALNYSIYSRSGEKVRSKENVSGIDQLQIGFAGIYIIRIEANRNVFYHKILSIQ